MNSNTHLENIPEVISALAAVHGIIRKVGDGNLEPYLCYLVLLRVSQINQCAYCIDMHTREARECNVSQDKLDQLIVYRQSALFNDKEKQALCWAEKLTLLSNETDYEDQREKLSKYFSSKNIGLLTTAIALINLWNRLRISTH